MMHSSPAAAPTPEPAFKNGQSGFEPFDYAPRTRVIFGPDSVGRVGQLVKELGPKRILLVTDAGIVAAGHARRVKLALEEAGLSVATFEEVQENPSSNCVNKCVALARKEGIDCIVGLGGGSSMDTAKGCNFVLTNGGTMKDYWGIGKATKPMLPLVAIPTTGGTGSECQSFALITDEETHQKMACGDPKAAARVAILDPILTVSQPPRVTACTGIDAIAHAVETAVTRKRTTLSMLYSRGAFRLLTAGFARVLKSPEDLEARGLMLLGAAWAGTAIENSMLGAAHSAANPLTAHFDVVHGKAVGLVLPHVVRFNAAEPVAAAAYTELAVSAGLCSVGESSANASAKLADFLQSLLPLAGLPETLSTCEIGPKDFPMLAEEAAKQWTAQFNPRSVGTDDFIKIYQSAS